MGFKSVELQIAIPRTQDAGKMQEQMMKQGQHFQDSLNHEHLRKQKLQRDQVNKFDHVRKQDVHDEDKRTHEETEMEPMEKDEVQQTLDHPFLGINIDYSG